MLLWILSFVCTVLVLYFVFYEYPSLNERLQSSTDEDEKSSIRFSILIIVTRSICMAIYIIVFIVMKIGGL